MKSIKRNKYNEKRMIFEVVIRIKDKPFNTIYSGYADRITFCEGVIPSEVIYRSGYVVVAFDTNEYKDEYKVAIEHSNRGFLVLNMCKV